MGTYGGAPQTGTNFTRGRPMTPEPRDDLRPYDRFAEPELRWHTNPETSSPTAAGPPADTPWLKRGGWFAASRTPSGFPSTSGGASSPSIRRTTNPEGSNGSTST